MDASSPGDRDGEPFAKRRRAGLLRENFRPGGVDEEGR